MQRDLTKSARVTIRNGAAPESRVTPVRGDVSPSTQRVPGTLTAIVRSGQILNPEGQAVAITRTPHLGGRDTANDKSPSSPAATSPTQIPILLPDPWFKIRAFESNGKLWDVPSKLYQGFLLNTVGRISYFSERLNYAIKGRDRASIEEHVHHTKQHESFHVVAQAAVVALGIASVVTQIPILGGTGPGYITGVLVAFGVFNVASILHQRAQRGQCERILDRMNRPQQSQTGAF